MDIVNFQWKVINPAVGPCSKRCYLGRIRVGIVTWHLGSRNEVKTGDYVGHCLLPGPTGGCCESSTPLTEDEAIKWVEATVKSWFAAVTK